MASITGSFTASAVRIVITGLPAGNGEHGSPDLQKSGNPIVRAVAQEFAANGTTSGTITITAS